ncbi:MAG: hypothetical protein OEU36_23115 [Gammaproteobacteria bacterium]|nr:hypothetical protein [Gammaproteobacteria bacterium]
MTRAKQRLFLSHAGKPLWRGKVEQRQVSPFLQDIEQQLLEISLHRKRKARAKQDNPQLQLF